MAVRTGYRDTLVKGALLSAFGGLEAESESHGLNVPLQRRKDVRSNLDARYARGFVSRDQIRGEESAGSNRPEVQPPDSATNTPSVRAASSEELDKLTAAPESAPPEESQGSGWSGGMLAVSIGAVAFLLALAGYRVFSPKGRSGSVAARWWAWVPGEAR